MRKNILTTLEVTVAMFGLFVTICVVLTLSATDGRTLTQAGRIGWFVSSGAVASLLFVIGRITGHNGKNFDRPLPLGVSHWDDEAQEIIRHMDHYLAVSIAIVGTFNFCTYYAYEWGVIIQMVVATIGAAWLLAAALVAYKIKNPPELNKIARVEPRVMENLTHRPWLFSRTHKPAAQPWIFSRSHQPRAWEQQPTQPWDFAQLPNLVDDDDDDDDGE